jgi:two-component system, NtrC family, sensor histidine kinase HydH
MAGFLRSELGMIKEKYNTLFAGFSPWIVLGAVLVLLPIMALMTVETIKRQQQQRIRLMMEKGAALIRSFEAGTRMGMRGGHGSGFQLQRLLVETAAQPDIAHLLVVRLDGTVIAHNRVDQVGMRYNDELSLSAIHEAGALEWRETVSPEGDRVFEIFGKFAPLARSFDRPRNALMPGRMGTAPLEREASPMVIFVGLRTDALDAAHAADARQTVVMAAVLLLVGCTGVLLLFLAQNYRSTRTSLAQVKVFSDNLVSRMPIGLVTLDQNGRVTALNSVAESILGINTAAVMGVPAQAVIPAILLEALAGETGLVEREILCPLSDGRRIPMDVSAATLTDDNGDCFGQVILFKDLTEIRTLHQELEKNRRLASVGRLAAGVAHEIRNPLSSIKGFATYFKDKYRESDKDQEIAAILIQEVDRLNRVVGQLLEFSRPMTLHLQPVVLKPFLEDVCRQMGRQSEAAGVRVSLDIVDDRLIGLMDADKMRQVMLNLLLNALDAMTAGGGLTVRARSGRDGGVSIEVIDGGVGIGPNDQPFIFEPYFSTKNSGTGLGLAIVHNIVTAHQGDILVESRVGQGTTVQITLPAPKEV